MASLSSPLFFKPTLTNSFTNSKPILLPSFVSFSGLSKPESRLAVIAETSNHSEAFFDSGNQALDVPVLSSSEAIERMRSYRENQERNQEFAAMYSSITGGITTDTAAMVIPIDDHMVHRGHSVFDTAAIVDGYLYELDQHLNRIIDSARMAKIALPLDKQDIRKILIKTASASKCRDGSLRYWITAGPGDFMLTPSPKSRASLYAVVIRGRVDPDPTGAKVITSTVPMKAPQFGRVKSTNYLANALAKMEAEEAGAAAGVWVDGKGVVAEGPSMNVAFLSRARELVMPRFEKILGGCTAKRALTLAEKLLADGTLAGVNVRDITVQEGKAAREMMLLGSGVLVRPVTRWDHTPIGDGKEGHVTKALLDLLIEDMKYGPPSVRVRIPTEV